MSEPDKASVPAPAKGGGSSRLGLVAALTGVLNIGGTAAVAAKVYRAPKHVEASAHGEPHSAEPSPKPQPPPPVVALEPFVVNLNEEGSTRYLKTTFELELQSEKVQPLLLEKKRAVRDEMLRYLSSLSVADTLGEANKTKIQEQMVTRATKVLGKDAVTHVFFTEFVVQ
jgi:flagellar basal body-associated protein FliL